MAAKNSALRNKIADDFGALWDTSGTLKIYTSGAVLLAEFSLSADAFAAAAAGVINLNGLPLSDAANATGIADNATLSSAADTYQITGLTVGESGTQVVLDNVDINSGQTVTINSFSYTVSASVS